MYADFSWVPPGSCCTLVSLIVLILSAILGLHRMTRARSPIHVHNNGDDEVAAAMGVCHMWAAVVSAGPAEYV